MSSTVRTPGMTSLRRRTTHTRRGHRKVVAPMTGRVAEPVKASHSGKAMPEALRTAALAVNIDCEATRSGLVSGYNRAIRLSKEKRSGAGRFTPKVFVGAVSGSKEDLQNRLAEVVGPASLKISMARLVETTTLLYRHDPARLDTFNLAMSTLRGDTFARMVTLVCRVGEILGKGGEPGPAESELQVFSNAYVVLQGYAYISRDVVFDLIDKSVRQVCDLSVPASEANETLRSLNQNVDELEEILKRLDTLLVCINALSV